MKARGDSGSLPCRALHCFNPHYLPPPSSNDEGTALEHVPGKSRDTGPHDVLLCWGREASHGTVSFFMDSMSGEGVDGLPGRDEEGRESPSSVWSGEHSEEPRCSSYSGVGPVVETKPKRWNPTLFSRDPLSAPHGCSPGLQLGDRRALLLRSSKVCVRRDIVAKQ